MARSLRGPCFFAFWGAWGRGGRIATGALRPRNDRGFTRGAVGGGTHGSRPTAEHFVGQGPCALPGVQHKTDGRTEASAPTERSKKCGGAGRCGERTERCQWQKQRSERVAAVKISSVRRKAAQKFWAPQQGHRPLRKRNKRCNGRATARVAPTEGYKECDAVRYPPFLRPFKIIFSSLLLSMQRMCFSGHR